MALKVAIKLFDGLETNRFLSLFKVIQPRLNVKFVLSQFDEADVVIIEQNDSLDFKENLSNSSALGIIYGSHRIEKPGLSINKPVKMAELVSVLNQAAEKLNVNRVTSKFPTTDKKTVKRQSAKIYPFQPGHASSASLLKILTQLDSQQTVSINNTAIGRLYVDMSQGICFSHCEQNVDIVSQLIYHGHQEEALTVSIINQDLIKKLATEEQLSYWRIEELIWGLAINQQPAKLMRGFTMDDAVRLKRWPNLTRVVHTPAQTRLCAMMFQEDNSLQNLIVKAQVPKDEAVSFFNACVLTGLIVKRDRQIEKMVDTTAPQPDEQSVLSKIIKHLFG